MFQFKVNKGNKFGDFGYCPLDRGCPLHTGFTVHDMTHCVLHMACFRGFQELRSPGSRAGWVRNTGRHPHEILPFRPVCNYFDSKIIIPFV